MERTSERGSSNVRRHLKLRVPILDAIFLWDANQVRDPRTVFPESSIADAHESRERGHLRTLALSDGERGQAVLPRHA
jgi:hypothetical protein